MTKMNIKHLNYYGLDHEAVNEKFKGDLTYLGDIVFIGQYSPWALYHSANPDRNLGHKEFMLLSVSEDGGYVSGREKEDFKIKERFKNLVHCKTCGDAIYSCMRHDFSTCTCGNVSVDGGIDYFKMSWDTGAEYEVLTLDILTGKTYTDEEIKELDIDVRE